MLVEPSLHPNLERERKLYLGRVRCEPCATQTLACSGDLYCLCTTRTSNPYTRLMSRQPTNISGPRRPVLKNPQQSPLYAVASFRTSHPLPPPQDHPTYPPIQD